MNLNKNKNFLNIFVFLAIFLCSQTVFVTNSFAATDKNLLSAIKYQEEGKYPEAITKYYEIIENSPKNLDAYYNLAMILEIVLADYESAVRLYDKALSIAENMLAFFMPGQEGRSKDDFNNVISKVKERKVELIDKIYNSIEGVEAVRYVVLKAGKNASSKSLNSTRNEFRFINIDNNRYHVATTDQNDAWIEGKDIRLIYQNSNERNELSAADKAERYKNFANTFPGHKFANKARNKMNSMTRTQTFQQKPVVRQQPIRPPAKANPKVQTNSVKKKTAQEQLNEIDERHKKGSISDEERKRLRMEVLKNL